MNTQMMSVGLGFPPAGARTIEAPALDAEPVKGRVDDANELLVPIRPQSWMREWRIEACVPRLARLHARTRLGVMAWPGNRNAAVRIVTEVVQNAVDHGGKGRVELILSADEDDVLFIDVTDPRPGHERLDEALAGSRDETGLGLVRHLGGEVSWFPAESGNGKTIRVRMLPPGGTGPTTPAAEAP
ncbi:ATP-binding protein [Streptomyces scabiei]|uniref:ATP-binding protein n=1 Tax=Streptomyces scabiei TaxID=1930 RepID=UPI0033F39792